ncbi:MAG: hypothetical protein LBF68_08110, partial [Christensenellaceae bacterium]|nr:hypothetical protein [Christensenellaceae bacterium]
ENIDIYTYAGYAVASSSISLTFTSANGQVYQDVLPTKPGVYEVAITYAGDETTEAVTVVYQYVVEGADNSVLIWIGIASVIVVIGVGFILAGIKRRSIKR